VERRFNIIKKSEDYGSPLKRRICIDIDPDDSHEIRDYLYSHVDYFNIIAERILTQSNLYFDGFKREKDDGARKVSAMKFFDKKNTRIYCQEMRNEEGQFFIICAKLYKKKSQKNNKKNQPLLEAISNYEYTYKP